MRKHISDLLLVITFLGLLFTIIFLRRVSDNQALILKILQEQNLRMENMKQK